MENNKKYEKDYICLDQMEFEGTTYFYLMGHSTPELKILKETSEGLKAVDEEKSEIMIQKFTKRLIKTYNN